MSEPVPAPTDPMIDGLLATIRGLSHRITEETDPDRIQALTRSRTREERAVRLAWAATSGAGRPSAVLSPDELVSHLGERILVQLVNVDGTLHAVVVRDGRWRRVAVGPLADARKAMDRALYGLRSATRGRPIPLEPLGVPTRGRPARTGGSAAAAPTARW